ncbi:hypothetical protein MMC10_006320 [Thelotrema lepadinum]|nr:hypothetical protein [Thelotrema lepadinum]
MDDTYAIPAASGHEAGFRATAGALDTLTTASVASHADNPTSHLHTLADTSHASGWLAKHFDTTALTSHLQALENRHHLGNFVLDRTTGNKTWESMSIYVRLGMHLLYYGSEQEKLLHSSRTVMLLKEQSEKMGREYDDPASRAHIKPFMQGFGLEASMKDMVQEDPEKYATFNEFFAREIKASARPVAEEGDERVASSPADCRLTAFPTVDAATRFWVKGFGFGVLKLVGGDEGLAAELEGGAMVIARLAPQDYHRWHAPVSGTVEGTREIPGAYYTVNPQAINEEGTMDVFCENRRSVMTIKRDGSERRVVVVAVGAMLVGSIRYKEGVAVTGRHVKRGECLGAFYYGGSTVIVLFPKGEVVLDEDLVKNSVDQNCETLMKVGWRVGASK